MYAFKQKMERPGSGLTLIGPFKQLGPGLKFIRGLALIGFPCIQLGLVIYFRLRFTCCPYYRGVHEARIEAAAVFQDLLTLVWSPTGLHHVSTDDLEAVPANRLEQINALKQ